MARGTPPARTAELVADLRESADSRRKPAITTLDNLLFDVWSTCRTSRCRWASSARSPPAAAREGVERVWRMGWPFWAKRKLRGLRLEATDVDWTVGDGAVVRGPAQALLLLLTGRDAAALPALAGPGVARLSQGAGAG
jgi:hypothetical protein